MQSLGMRLVRDVSPIAYAKSGNETSQDVSPIAHAKSGNETRWGYLNVFDIVWYTRAQDILFFDFQTGEKPPLLLSIFLSFFFCCLCCNHSNLC